MLISFNELLTQLQLAVSCAACLCVVSLLPPLVRTHRGQAAKWASPMACNPIKTILNAQSLARQEATEQEQTVNMQLHLDSMLVIDLQLRFKIIHQTIFFVEFMVQITKT